MSNIKSKAMELSRKPTRKAAFEAVNSLIEFPEDKDIQERYLAILYAHFRPATPKSAKTDIEWISKAVAKMDVRYYLNYLYESHGRLQATDGHRLHWVPSDKDRGYLVPVTGDEVDCDGTYPDTGRVIPTKVADESIKITDLKKTIAEEGSSYKYKYEFPNGAIFNGQFIDEALNGETEFYWNRPVSDCDTLRIASLDNKRHAVIMPMRK